MRIKELIKDCLFKLSTEMVDLSSLDYDISSIVYDSRKVRECSLFVAIKGEVYDGKDFVKDAIEKGAKGIVFEGDPPIQNIGKDIFLLKVRDARKALACLSHNFFGRPSEGLNVIGVTGTNGKTTTTYLIKTILETSGRSTGLIGTISYSFKGYEYPAMHTTPEAPEFQSLIKDMLINGCEYVVAEVSSHSLNQRRVDYTRFPVAVFTNLSRDHLDFHKTMEDYYLSKRRLFTELLMENGTAIINRDALAGERLISDLSLMRPDIKMITYGLTEGATVTPIRIEKTTKGSSLTVRVLEGDHKRELHIQSTLIGTPNVYNILSALSVAISLNIPKEIIEEGFRKDTIVKGRFERIEEGQDFLCIVDYAHTPDALERLIITARDLSDGRVITVFGCGGNRDKGKRPIMGRIATDLSDYVIITSDNPRNEDPDAIISDITSDLTKDNYEIIPDRAIAIKKAIMMAEKGDIVLIAGKGHEDYQEIKGKRERFSDHEVCIKELKERFLSCRV